MILGAIKLGKVGRFYHGETNQAGYFVLKSGLFMHFASQKLRCQGDEHPTTCLTPCLNGFMIECGFRFPTTPTPSKDERRG
jgi:hypothetical protein